MKYTLKEIARHVKIQRKEEYEALRKLVDELERRGVVATDDRARISYLPSRQTGKEKGSQPGKVIGTITVSKRGVGLVRPEQGGDEILIAPKFMKTALHGDIVAVIPFARPVMRRREEGMPQLEGEVVEIVRRTTGVLTGTLEHSGHFWFVVPDNARFTRDIYLSENEAEKAERGDKVVVHLLPWTDEHLNPEGTILEVLGRSGDARVEVMSVARSFGLPMGFSREVLREADRLPGTIPSAELHMRADFRSLTTITIDPEDAKDFDDALSCELLPGSRLRLGVHIADVSHFVRGGTALDAEALARGTSVYMVNEVIPMLPERLSNELCSLRPREDRLTFSVVMDVNSEGKVEHYRILRSVIHSKRRFSYEEAQKVIEAERGDHAEVILPLQKLAQILLKRRRKNGSIDFDTAEAKFTFDRHGFPSAILKKTRLDAHRLVEECMLLANVTVARHIAAAGEDAKPFVYRIHDQPDPERLRELGMFVKQFGFSLDVKSGVTSRALQKLLDEVKGSEVETLINEVALRSMAKAIYSEKNIGHYGLGFPHYTHFTSPIRRYPDLVIHRLLAEYEQAVPARRLNALRESLPGIAQQSSARERLAMEAERASVRVMQVEYMKRHIGDEFDGVIGGVTNFGMFVEINDLLVEGLIRVRDLADDYYLFDEKHYALRGRSRGRVFRLGDPVRVKVAAVNPEERSMDFVLADADQKSGRKDHGPSSRRERRK